MILLIGSRIMSQDCGQPNARNNLKSMTLVGSRFLPAPVGFEETSLMGDVPGILFGPRVHQ